jgi:hypothetical protein
MQDFTALGKAFNSPRIPKFGQRQTGRLDAYSYDVGNAPTAQRKRKIHEKRTTESSISLFSLGTKARYMLPSRPCGETFPTCPGKSPPQNRLNGRQTPSQTGPFGKTLPRQLMQGPPTSGMPEKLKLPNMMY